MAADKEKASHSHNYNDREQHINALTKKKITF